MKKILDIIEQIFIQLYLIIVFVWGIIFLFKISAKITAFTNKLVNYIFPDVCFSDNNIVIIVIMIANVLLIRKIIFKLLRKI